MVVPIRYTGRCEGLQSELLPDGFSRYLVHMEIGGATVSTVDITTVVFPGASSSSSRKDVLVNIDYSSPFAVLFAANPDVAHCIRNIFEADDNDLLGQLVFINRVFADSRFVDSAPAREAILMALVESLPIETGVLCVNPSEDLIVSFHSSSRPTGWPFEMGIYQDARPRATEAGHLFGETYFGFLFIPERETPVFVRPFTNRTLHLPVNPPEVPLTPEAINLYAIRMGGYAVAVSKSFATRHRGS